MMKSVLAMLLFPFVFCNCARRTEMYTHTDDNGVHHTFFAYEDTEGNHHYHGPYTQQHPSGISYAAYYRHGNQTGTEKAWNSDGRLILQIPSPDRKGRARGRHLICYADGTPKSEAFFRRGLQVGTWTTYKPDGEVFTRGDHRFFFTILSTHVHCRMYLPWVKGSIPWNGTFLRRIKDRQTEESHEYIEHYKKGQLLITTDIDGTPLNLEISKYPGKQAIRYADGQIVTKHLAP